MQSDTKATLGEKLVLCIQIGIKYSERHKGRARLKQETPERHLSSHRIASDVEAAIKRIVRHTASPTDFHRMLKSLKSLLKQLKNGIADDKTVENWVWEALAIPKPLRQFGSPEDFLKFSGQLERLIQQEQNSISAQLSSPRGRRPDGCLRSTIQELANIYHAYTGFRATATEAKDGSGMKGPFFNFIMTIFNHYADHPMIDDWLQHNGTLNGAIRWVASTEGEVEAIPERDPQYLDGTLFPEN